MAEKNDGERKARKQSCVTPFYYHLWHADGTERLQQYPVERRRTCSNSSSSDVPHYEIPPSRGKLNHHTSIDETTTPKRLTIATESMICKFSSTHLSKLQDTIAAVENNPERFALNEIANVPASRKCSVAAGSSSSGGRAVSRSSRGTSLPQDLTEAKKANRTDSVQLVKEENYNENRCNTPAGDNDNNDATSGIRDGGHFNAINKKSTWITVDDGELSKNGSHLVIDTLGGTSGVDNVVTDDDVFISNRIAASTTKGKRRNSLSKDFAVTRSTERRLSEFVYASGRGRDTLHESRVLVLYTGGTIGMRCRNGVYLPEQHYLPGAIRQLPPLNDGEYVEGHYSDAKVKPYCLPPVRGVKKRVVYWLVEYEPLLDSSDMTFDDWIRIARDIEKSYNAYDGFVILHGTDTLAYTACALSFMMENLGKPVVLTGAQIPVAEVRSDGRENMIGALIVAGSIDIPEVCVLFNNKLMRGCRVTKMDNHGLDAFQSPNMAPLATMDISINVNYESIFRSPDVAPFRVHGNLCRSVIVLRIFPSMPIESVIASLKPPARGVVLQTFGSGNMPSRRTDIIAEIARAVERGCLVLNVTQCFKGHVEVTYANGKLLADTGVIAGSDLTTEAALTKLAYVLAKDEWDSEMKLRMLSQNLRGELTVVHSEHLDEMDLIPRLAKFLRITSSIETRLLRNALFPPLVCNAAHANDVELLEQLRLNGANVASIDYSQRTALHAAASAGSADAVDYLLRHGVSVHTRDSSDDNALMCAVRSKNLRVIRAIRKAGGQLVAPLARIGVELCLAANRGDLQALRAWREAGADFSTPDYDGRTALHLACSRGLHRVAEFLCANGASTKVRDRFNVTPEDECARKMSIIETLHRGISSPMLLCYDNVRALSVAENALRTFGNYRHEEGNDHESEEEEEAVFDVEDKSMGEQICKPTFSLTDEEDEDSTVDKEGNYRLPIGEDPTNKERYRSERESSGEDGIPSSSGATGVEARAKEARRIYGRLQKIAALLRRHSNAEHNDVRRLAQQRRRSDIAT